MSESVLWKVVRKLCIRSKLDNADIEGILSLPHFRRTYEPPFYLLREGEPPRKYCSFIISGLAFRQKLTLTGTRQILSLHMPGDFLDLQHLFLHRSDHNLEALTQLETIELDRDELQNLILRRPAIARAMWVEALVDASIFREWIVNVGRRQASVRIAHLLCEFATRLNGIGHEDGAIFELPMTQEQIGDAVGLTSIHVNRTLKALASSGLIERSKRSIRFNYGNRLRMAADFSALYLHLDQMEPKATALMGEMDMGA